MDVNHGEYAGTPMTNGGGRYLESHLSQAICFENGHLVVEGERLVQDNDSFRNERKAANPCGTKYDA